MLLRVELIPTDSSSVSTPQAYSIGINALLLVMFDSNRFSSRVFSGFTSIGLLTRCPSSRADALGNTILIIRVAISILGNEEILKLKSCACAASTMTNRMVNNRLVRTSSTKLRIRTYATVTHRARFAGLESQHWHR